MNGAMLRRCASAALLAIALPVGALAQEQSALPPEGMPPLLRTVALEFPAQGNVSSVDPVTYLYHMEVTDHVSAPSQGRWVPYTDATEEIIREDFWRLWETGFLDDLSIELSDEPWENGVMGKRVTFKLEERPQVRIVTFEGSDAVNRADIETAMDETGLAIRTGSFLDEGRIRRVEGLLREMFSAQGYQFADISHEITGLAGGPKVVQLTFSMSEGPKVQIEEIEFVGNTALSDGELKGQMEQTKERWWLSWMTGRGTYKEVLFEQDAERVQAYYLANGYLDARVGLPETDYLEPAPDGKSRGMRLRIPIEEGERYRVGTVRFDGNNVITNVGLGALFGALKPGEFYSQSAVLNAIEQARDLYGALGYTEMTMYADPQPRLEAPVLADSVQPNGEPGAAGGTSAATPSARDLSVRIDGNPVVDVTIRIEEGEQHFVRRINFIGNESTYDEVIRRELQLVEGGVFNTAALQSSIRRLNQLGYFEPLDEEQAFDVAEVDGEENEVDLTLNLSETNLNQLTFGAGVSQFDGFFGQLSFSTTNFLGRGETLSVAVQSGARLRDYTLGFTEPYIFGRNMSAGFSVYSRRVEWIGSFTEDRTGGSVTVGWPLALFTRAFVSYSYERTGISELSPFIDDSEVAQARNPFLADALLLRTGGERTINKITPALRYNTVNHPIFPTRGTAYSASVELARVSGNDPSLTTGGSPASLFWKPSLEATWYIPHLSRTVIGLRTQYQHVVASDSAAIPVYERLWLGGEFSVRGFDIRRIGPTLSDVDDEISEDTLEGRTVLGGNKSLLFNAEYGIIIASPVRLVLFYDAGQVQNFGDAFAMDDFKTSTGVELRFFVPMLNVPFRLIYAWNPQRSGIYNDQFREQEDSEFRFAVGTTF